MLLERAERWPRQWEAKGRQKGRQEGRREGRQEGLEEGLRKGKSDLLKAQASHRFGDLPQSTADRFDRADVDTLDRWSRRLLDAKCLEAVFDDAP